MIATYILAFFDLFAVSLVVPAFGGHFLGWNFYCLLTSVVITGSVFWAQTEQFLYMGHIMAYTICQKRSKNAAVD